MKAIASDERVAHRSTIHSVPAAEADADWKRAHVGRVVGPSHRIVRHLATGSLGDVFLVEHVHIGAYAALKLARRDGRSASRALAHEAKLLSSLRHPNIVRVMDSGQLDDGRAYLLIEYAHGLECDVWLAHCGNSSPARALWILEQVASAVDYLHAHGVVHCDIKPANLMVDPSAGDFATLLDFDIAFRVVGEPTRNAGCGTPGYMAPEQLRGEACTSAVDVYGVAALAMELFTGGPPVETTTTRRSIATYFDASAPLCDAGLRSPGLEAVFACGLHADPQLRFESAGDFVRALQQTLRGSGLDRYAARDRDDAARIASPASLATGRAKTLRARGRTHER